MFSVLRRASTTTAKSLILTAALVAAGASVEAGETGPPPSGKSFVDNFKKIDTKRWFVADGWSNGAHQACMWSKSNARKVAGGLDLVITDQPSAPTDKPDAQRPYRCAEMQTNELFGYGTYEARMSMGAGAGTVSTFFTYIGPSFGNLPHDEIDFEFLGKNRNAVQLNYFVNGQGKHEKIIDLGFDASAGLNDYAFEWMPDGLRWYANGNLIHEIKGGEGTVLPSHPGKIFISIWAGADTNMEQWLGRFEYPGQPIRAKYEYVAFTEAGAPCQFPTSIVCARGAAQPK